MFCICLPLNCQYESYDTLESCLKQVNIACNKGKLELKFVILCSSCLCLNCSAYQLGLSSVLSGWATTFSNADVHVRLCVYCFTDLKVPTDSKEVCGKVDACLTPPSWHSLIFTLFMGHFIAYLYVLTAGTKPGYLDYMIWPIFVRFRSSGCFGEGKGIPESFTSLHPWVERMMKDKAVQSTVHPDSAYIEFRKHYRKDATIFDTIETPNWSNK